MLKLQLKNRDTLVADITGKKGGFKIMQLRYTISKVGNSIKNIGVNDGWYAHLIGFPYIPVMIDGCKTFGTKREALNNAAMKEGLTYKEYMKLRSKSYTK